MATVQDFSDLGATPIESYSDLGGIPAQTAASPPMNAQPDAQPPLYQRVIADVDTGLLNTAQGANRFLTNALVNPVRQALGYPGNWQTPQYNWGQTLGAGNTMPDQLVQGAAGFAPAGALGEAVPVAEGIAAVGTPFAARAADYLAQSPRLAGLADQLAPNMAFGATQNPDPVIGAAQGVGATALGAAPSGAGALWSKVSQAVNPAKYANDFLSAIGGQQTLANNAKSLAQDVQNSFNQQKANASALYNPIFGTYGDSNIYDRLNNKYTGGADLPASLQGVGVSGPSPVQGAYQSLSPKITENYTPDLNDMHDAFLQNPTLQNAHNLQSQLGASVRDYQGMAGKGTLTTADRINMQNYQRAQNAVLGDMGSFLDSKQQGLGDQYTAANQNYATNVSPYISNPAIAKIASGDVDYPKNINAIFAKPTPDIQKVVQDIGQSANNKILYNQLGTPQNSATPEKLASAMQNLDKAGLSDYLLPAHQDFMDTLNQKINNKNAVMHGAGYLGGALAFNPMGEGLGELAGALVGNAVLPSSIRGLQKILPMQAIKNYSSQGWNTIYPPLRNAGIGAAFQPSVYPSGGLGAPIVPNQ